MMKKALLPLLFLLIGCNAPAGGKQYITTTYEIDFTQFSTTEYADFTSDNESKYIKNMTDMLNFDGDIVETVCIDGYSQYKTSNVIDGKLRALFVCSGTQDGSLTITFNREIKSFTISAQAYYNCWMDTWTDPANPHMVFSCDLISNVFVNDNEIPLPTINFDDPKEPETITRSFTINSDSLIISGIGAQRAFIKNLIITTEDEA